ncbi:hypothetical protein [Pyxidicoccus caerfyrddinensis]|uniref:hypothetical protein n=1 Tax=Pyxidicoccus caerfyrddinensis TaxID=2709663 RepID=UPI0013DC6403|nr:hypothetical protein [Pyxidicoccus caerfyrddinensis]
MSWRTAVGACVALLFPLPMVILLGSALRLGMPEQQLEHGRRVAPVLRSEERLRLQSYHRNCKRDSDCEFPMGCLSDARAKANYCSDSQCLTDMQCGDGEVCRALTTFGEGPLVRICVPIGIRKEGELCVEIGKDLHDACGPGLICGGQAGFCARTCNQDDPNSCPKHYACTDTRLGPLCLPTCEKSGCPEGQECIHYEEGASSCEKVYGTNCQTTPCPENQKCELDHETEYPATVWMQCAQYCRKDRTSCPPGLICDNWACQPPCEPNGPNTCAEGYRCKKARPTRPWVCLPDW